MMITILVVVALVGSCVSVCPDFETFNSLDLSQFSGNWQVLGMIRSQGTDPKMQCMEADFVSDNWSVAPVNVETTLKGEYIETGAAFSQIIPTTIPSLGSPGVWNMNINGTASVYSVLDVNYSTYSLSVTCATVNGVDELVAFFKTRLHDEPIPIETVENYKGLLRGYGVDTNAYFEISHDHEVCDHHA